MKKHLLLALAGLFALASCDDNDVTTLDVELYSGGGEYTFSESVVVQTSPDEFHAEVKNNTIVGVYAGETTALVTAGNVEYKCNITVLPAYTYYVDMAIYVGSSKSAIEALFGSSLNDPDEDGISLYAPLSSSQNETAVAFIYENNTVVCAASYFAFSKAEYVVKHLSQRYAPYGFYEDALFMGNALDADSATLFVVYDYSYTDLTYVMYIDCSWVDLASTKSFGGAKIEAIEESVSSVIDQIK